MKRSDFKLGDKIKDTVTGLAGIAVACTEWMNGCQRVTIQPQEVKDGKPVDHYTVDIEQCELMDAKPAPAPSKGGDRQNPTRQPDPVRS